MVVEEDENVFLELPEARTWQGIFATVSGLLEAATAPYRYPVLAGNKLRGSSVCAS